MSFEIRQTKISSIKMCSLCDKILGKEKFVLIKRTDTANMQYVRVHLKHFDEKSLISEVL